MIGRMTTSPDETIATTVVPADAESATHESVETPDPKPEYARVGDSTNGYKVVSQHPVPDSVRKVASRTASGTLPLLFGLLLSVFAFAGGLKAEFATPLIVAMTVAPTALGCFLSMRLEHTHKRTLSEDPTVLAMSADSGISAEDIANSLFRVATAEQKRPVAVRSHTKVFVNIQEFAEDTGKLIRVIPKGEQSIGLLQKDES
jgi:hypothetical protein